MAQTRANVTNRNLRPPNHTLGALRYFLAVVWGVLLGGAIFGAFYLHSQVTRASRSVGLTEVIPVDLASLVEADPSAFDRSGDNGDILAWLALSDGTYLLVWRGGSTELFSRERGSVAGPELDLLAGGPLLLAPLSGVGFAVASGSSVRSYDPDGRVQTALVVDAPITALASLSDEVGGDLIVFGDVLGGVHVAFVAGATSGRQGAAINGAASELAATASVSSSTRDHNAWIRDIQIDRSENPPLVVSIGADGTVVRHTIESGRLVLKARRRDERFTLHDPPLENPARTRDAESETRTDTTGATLREQAGGSQSKGVADLRNWPGFGILRALDPKTETGSYFCGASVISKTWVLTAAHCVVRFIPESLGMTGAAEPDAKLQVVIGVDNLARVRGSDVFDVRRIVMHPEFFDGFTDAAARTATDTSRSVAALVNETSLKLGSDVALLELGRPWDGALALLSRGGARDPIEGDLVYLAGFGAVAADQRGTGSSVNVAAPVGSMQAGSATLMEGALRVISGPSCSRAYTSAAIDAGTGGTQVCASSRRSGVGFCQGDSGGPLVSARDINGCRVVVGVPNWSVGCDQSKSPLVAARVSAFIGWIEGVVSNLPASGSNNCSID